MLPKTFVSRHVAAAPIGFTIAALISFFPASPSAAATDNPPTVVEFFQSQGCTSCPPSITNNPNTVIIGNYTPEAGAFRLIGQAPASKRRATRCI